VVWPNLAARQTIYLTRLNPAHAPKARQQQLKQKKRSIFSLLPAITFLQRFDISNLTFANVGKNQ